VHTRRRNAQDHAPNEKEEKSMMMLDWNECQKQIGATVAELMKLSPDTVRGYQTLSAANS
jgi:hypothetical protein